MKTPWHLWAIGIVSLIWNSGGAVDYFMTKTKNADYLAALTAEQLAYFEGFPLWANIAWAFGVWGAVAGSLLLLFRSRFAGTAFALSLAGMAVNLAHGFFVSKVSMLDMMGGFAMTFTIALVLIAIGLWYYARRMTRSGVLR